MEASQQAEETLQKNMEQLEALKITMEMSRKDMKEKQEKLRLQTMLLKEPEKRKDLSSELEESKEAKKRRLLQELKDLDEDADVIVISDTLLRKEKEAKEVKEAITANQIKIRCFQDLLIAATILTEVHRNFTEIKL